MALDASLYTPGAAPPGERPHLRVRDPAAGTHPIRADVACDVDRPEDLEALVHCAHNQGGREESRGDSVKELHREAIEAAKQLARHTAPHPYASER
ncbi:hypothetical protein ACFWOJ_06400 [Streptomyces sp. NPDC058439]|uniref:hypothetical protein n=1 Tax=Streptomyces sp. NPDC058439 TaxID=3346500 RepID=UPI00365C20CF